MTILGRIFAETACRVLRSDSIYRMAKAFATSGEPTALPCASEAVETLESASPRPPRCTGVEPRAWPERPLVEASVIVPCYNAEQYVVECIRSILGQKTSRSFEVIAVNDGSTDATGELLDGIAACESRLRVVHQNNRGFSGARNIGIALAEGGLLLFVDSDDVLEPDALEILISAFDEGGCDFVTANYSVTSQDGTAVVPPLGRRNHGAPWGRAYSREVWRDLEFPERFWFEDTVQPFCIDTRYTERYIEQSVYRYRSNSKGISAKCASYKKSLDTFWIVGELLEWCRRLGIPFGQELLDKSLYQMGPIMLFRCSALSPCERKALFAASCDLLLSTHEFDGMSTTLGGRWDDVLLALRTRNYRLWLVACHFK